MSFNDTCTPWFLNSYKTLVINTHRKKDHLFMLLQESIYFDIFEMLYLLSRKRCAMYKIHKKINKLITEYFQFQKLVLFADVSYLGYEKLFLF